MSIKAAVVGGPGALADHPELVARRRAEEDQIEGRDDGERQEDAAVHAAPRDEGRQRAARRAARRVRLYPISPVF